MVRIRVTNRSGTRRIDEEKRLAHKVDSFYKTFKKSLALREFNLDKGNHTNYIYAIILNIMYGFSFGISRNLFSFLLVKLKLSKGKDFEFNYWCFIWAPALIALFHILAGGIFYIYQSQNFGRLLLLVALAFVHCVFLFFLDVFFKLLFAFFNINMPISIGFTINIFLTGYILSKSYSSDLSTFEDRDILIFTCIKMLSAILINIPHFFGKMPG